MACEPQNKNVALFPPEAEIICLVTQSFPAVFFNHNRFRIPSHNVRPSPDKLLLQMTWSTTSCKLEVKWSTMPYNFPPATSYSHFRLGSSTLDYSPFRNEPPAPDFSPVLDNAPWDNPIWENFPQQQYFVDTLPTSPVHQVLHPPHPIRHRSKFELNFLYVSMKLDVAMVRLLARLFFIATAGFSFWN